MNINRVFLYGNLTRDPELRQTQGGQAVCSFSIATNRKWKGKDGQQQEDVQFHNVVAWGKTAELVNQYMKKGSGLYVEGRLQTRSYVAKDGTKRYVTEVVVENMQFGARKTQESAQGSEDQGRDDAGHQQAQESPKEDEIDVTDTF